jgi:hypothetical protein
VVCREETLLRDSFVIATPSFWTRPCRRLSDSSAGGGAPRRAAAERGGLCGRWCTAGSTDGDREGREKGVATTQATGGRWAGLKER